MIEKSKVLIIDDDVDVAEAMKVVLESSKYQVISANDGEDGFQKAKTEKPDVIILDVMMRHMTEGFDVTQNIRRNEKTKYIPILMITSIILKTGFQFSPETDGEFLPVDDFIEKPVQPDDLLNRVGKLLKLPKENINIEGRKSII